MYRQNTENQGKDCVYVNTYNKYVKSCINIFIYTEILIELMEIHFMIS